MAITHPSLIASFLVIAFAYSAVGFGGGSSYIALLALAGVPYTAIPLIGLICNLIVTLSGSWNFGRTGNFSGRLLWPFILGSIPCAYIGGRMQMSAGTFYLVLGTMLILAATRLLWLGGSASKIATSEWPFIGKVAIGCVLGLVAGVTGIGGGIFLSPLLLNLGWGQPKQIAAAAAAFILFNSTAGLFGQFTKAGAEIISFTGYLPLFAAVLIGGQIGSRLGASGRFKAHYFVRLTGILTFIVGVRLLIKQIHHDKQILHTTIATMDVKESLPEGTFSKAAVTTADQ